MYTMEAKEEVGSALHVSSSCVDAACRLPPGRLALQHEESIGPLSIMDDPDGPSIWPAAQRPALPRAYTPLLSYTHPADETGEL